MNRKKKIIIIIVLLILLFVVAVGLAVGLLLLRSTSIKLEVWPHDSQNSSLIKYGNKDASFLNYNEKLKEFLEEYRQSSDPTRQSKYTGANRVVCRYNSNIGKDQVCDVPVDTFFPCTSNFNYVESSTCLFLKLNNVRNWIPQPINSTAVMPKNMPDHLKNYIRVMQNAPEANNVWVSCEGRDPVDKINIGPLQYIPRQGFPVYYFPFKNQEGYLSPLVAVLFERPKTGVLINVVCTAWAKNIHNDEDDQQGTVQFSLQIN